MGRGWLKWAICATVVLALLIEFFFDPIAQPVMLTYIKKVPDVVWSGVVASVLTLIGVGMSNASNTRRLQLQLEHDSEEKTVDRKMKLRQEVYLEAAEELVNTMVHLGGLANMEAINLDIASGVREAYIAVSKLSLVSDDTTLPKVLEIGTSLTEALAALAPHAAPAQLANSEVRTANAIYEEVLAEQKRIQAKIADFVQSGTVDDLKWGILQRAQDGQMKLVDIALERRNEAYQRVIAGQAAYAEAALPIIIGLQARQRVVHVEMRRELGLRTDVKVLEQVQGEMMARLADSTKDMIGKITQKAATDGSLSVRRASP